MKAVDFGNEFVDVCHFTCGLDDDFGSEKYACCDFEDNSPAM